MPLNWVRLLTNKDETIKMKLSTKMKRGWSRGVGVTDMFLFRRFCLWFDQIFKKWYFAVLNTV